MQLPRDYYLEQLYAARPSEENLKALAIYIRTFKHDPATLVDGIEHVYSRSALYHRLTLYYLVNEVLQTERAEEGRELKTRLKDFLKKNFIKDKKHSREVDGLYKRFRVLQDIWEKRRVVDFDDKYSMDEIVHRLHEIFYDREKLVRYLEEICAYYRTKTRKSEEAAGTT